MLRLYEDNGGGLYWTADNGRSFLPLRGQLDGLALADARLWEDWAPDFDTLPADAVMAEEVAIYWPGGLTPGGGPRSEGIHWTGIPGVAARLYVGETEEDRCE